MATRDNSTEQGWLQQQEQEQSMMTQSSATMMTPPPGMMLVPIDPHRGECRGNAKIVAYVTIVINVMYLTLAFALFFILLFAVTGFGSGNLGPEGIFGKLGYVISLLLLLFFIISLVFAGIELWIACGLLSATDFGTRQEKAIKKATCWRCYHVFLVILNILTGGGFMIWSDGNDFIIGFGGYNFVLFLIRILCIYIVHTFIQELRRVGGPLMLGGVGAMAYANNQYQHQQQPYQYSRERRDKEDEEL